MVNSKKVIFCAYIQCVTTVITKFVHFSIIGEVLTSFTECPVTLVTAVTEAIPHSIFYGADCILMTWFVIVAQGHTVFTGTLHAAVIICVNLTLL